MATHGASTAQLLNCGDADFDVQIKSLPVKDLMALISSLQKEMTKEQDNFNGLSSALQGLKDRNSRQHKTISKDMQESQKRLTVLMNRSMKCFAQQNLQQSNGANGSSLQRRNSASKTAESTALSPTNPASIHRSQSMHSVSQPTAASTPALNSVNTASVVYRGGGGVMNRVMGKEVKVLQPRPASVVGIVNSVEEPKASLVRVSNGVTAPLSAPYISHRSSATFNPQPQTMMVVGTSDEPRGRSQSQIIAPTSSTNSTSLDLAYASSRPHSTIPTPLMHASSLESIPASASSSPTPAVEKLFNGLPSVRRLAQTFSGPGSSSATANTEAAGHRPVIRAQSIAGVDSLQREGNSAVDPGLTVTQSSSDSSKVNGIPTLSVTGGRVQGQYIKRTTAPKVAGSLPVPAATTSNQTELEKVHARLLSSRNMEFSTLPDRPAGSQATHNGEREMTSFRTNLDKKKSSSSIMLGKMSDFGDDHAGPSGKLSQPLQALGPMRRAQSREELYAIESQARSHKEAMLHEIHKRRADPEPAEMAPTPELSSSQWGLKGQNLLAKRLEQDVKGQSEQTQVTHNAPVATAKVTMHIQPSVPQAVSAGQAVHIRSSSRDNLADTQPSHRPAQPPPPPPPPTPPSATAVKAPSMSSSTAKATTLATPTVKPVIKTSTASQPVQGRAPPQQVTKVISPPEEETEAETQEDGDVDDESLPRMNLIDWDPHPVLEYLYKVTLAPETAEDISHKYVSMEGLMEKLPMNKKKSTLLKTWKRRFFRAKDGWLQYFEGGQRDKPSETLQLMGGHVDDLGNRILGIDDGRGHYLMVRAPTDREHGQWKVALLSQTADNTKATYIQPVLRSPPHPAKQVVVIDMGSGGIRAGILGEKDSLPQVFFPSVVAVNRETGRLVVGMDAYRPDVRKNATLLHPIRPSNKVDQFNIDVNMMAAIFGQVFRELGADPAKFIVMLSTPQTLSDSLRAGLMNALVEKMGVQAVCMVQQSLLALYSYRTTTGIIVDIGHRIEILPIYDGFVIEGGVSRCPYGSNKVQDSLKKSLLENNYKFASEVELLLVRHIMEQCCYVAYDYAEDEALCQTQPGKLKRTINFTTFNLPEGAYRTVDVEEGRFSSPEGFFNVDLWEMDYPTLHKLIFQAIQSCPMDNRRHMYRAVYLSGGVTMLPGFPERLETELIKLAPPAVTVQVHAAPNRYHAAYVGACAVASMPQFQGMVITKEEWKVEGVRAFRKWQASSS